MATFTIAGTPASHASITVTVTDAAIVTDGNYVLQWMSRKKLSVVAICSALTLATGSASGAIHFTGDIADLRPDVLSDGVLYFWDLSDPTKNVLLGYTGCGVVAGNPEPDDGVVLSPGEVAASTAYVDAAVAAGGGGKPPTAKTTVVDADGVTVWDSTSSWAARFSSWTTIWSNYLQAKAAALFATVGHNHSGVYSPVGAVPSTEKGAANGVAPLGADSKISTTYLPAAVLGALNYQSTWNANTNSPTIPVAASGNKGYYYVVSVDGTTNLDGIVEWKVGDWAISNGSVWQKCDNTDAVVSVAGLMGAIAAADLRTALALGTAASAALSDSNPVMSGTTAPGNGASVSRYNHVHPSDTARYRYAVTNAVGNVSGSVTADFATSLTNSYTLTGNCTALPAPANLADGETGYARFTLAGFSMVSGPAAGTYKGAWTVTGPIVVVTYTRVGAVYDIRADSPTLVT